MGEAGGDPAHRRPGAADDGGLQPRAGNDLGGGFLRRRLAASEQQTALGLSTNEREKFAGWHCEHLLVIVDEASGVPDCLFEVIQGTLTAAHCRLLLIGNPTRTDGVFFASHRREGWAKLKISAYDTPNFETGRGGEGATGRGGDPAEAKAGAAPRGAPVPGAPAPPRPPPPSPPA